jgi:N4-(beta-N-acetylglucosaminyl)-L-asparaginase
MSTTRRDFLSASAMVAVGMSGAARGDAEESGKDGVKYAAPGRPVIVTRETYDATIAQAYAMLERGEDTLEAALHICQGREDDANDHSVGLGGLPNEDGVVELDACVMHGPTRQAGSVAAVPNIRHAARLAQTVMERTGHVMIVGQGAEKFAVDEGFQKENLLTDDARKIWMLWKAHGNGWWGPGLDNPAWKPPAGAPGAAIPKAGLGVMPWGPVPRHLEREDAAMVMERMRSLHTLAERLGIEPRLRQEAVRQVIWPTTGTIHVSAVNAKGEMSGATTTSGLAWKIAGRVGDSPIIGAGCFTDQNVGSAGATGNGEENIKVAGAHTIVDQMRRGASPKEAGLEALRRIAANYDNDMTKLRYLDMIYYILRRDGAYAGVSLWSTRETGEPKTFVVHDGTQRTENVDYLFEGTTVSVHPF